MGTEGNMKLSKLTVAISKENHQELKAIAAIKDMTLQIFIDKALRYYISSFEDPYDPETKEERKAINEKN